MEVYRLSKKKYAKDLSGKGAELFGGRWNPIGIPALYTAENRALSILELLVHSPKKYLPKDLVLLSIFIPKRYEKEIVKITNKQLKKIWNSLRKNSISEQIGKSHFLEAKQLGIIVPSVNVPNEKNIVLNPNHSKFKYIKIKSVVDFSFDERLKS